MGIDLSALYREDATFAQVRRTYQYLIDTGQAWLMEGSVGRAAMDLIEAGHCRLGPTGHRDYWGNYVPSRREVVSGTKGSTAYMRRMAHERRERSRS